MHVPSSVIIGGIVVVALAGLLARHFIARIICWVLAAPPLIIGMLALWQGGIAEPFSERQMLRFCSLAFLPAAGCAIGQVFVWRKGARPQSNRKEGAR